MACCRHLVRISWNNGGREGPTCSVSVGRGAVSSSGLRTSKPYARRRVTAEGSPRFQSWSAGRAG